MRRRAFLAMAAVALGCGSAPPEPATPAKSKEAGAPAAATAHAGSVSTGVASYYADSLAGRPTASGEPYDPSALTAAHRTLPFGTLVEVSREGRAVVVRINDRGPFGKKKRIIDLSRRAAEELGMIRAGIASVTVRVVGHASGK